MYAQQWYLGEPNAKNHSTIGDVNKIYFYKYDMQAPKQIGNVPESYNII